MLYKIFFDGATFRTIYYGIQAVIFFLVLDEFALHLKVDLIE